MYQAGGAALQLGSILLVLCDLAACSPEQGVSGSSSDGLVFVRIVDGSSDLLRVRVSDGTEQVLTRTPDREETWPYWSDAARQLVFQTGGAGDGEAHDLRLWESDSGAESPFVETPEISEAWAAWSPTGRWIAYAFRGGSGPAGVAVKNLETRASLVLARSKKDEFYFRPHFAPGGRQLVAQRRGAGGRGSHLWVLAPGVAPRSLTRGRGWFDLKGGFTRDSQHVVYSRRPTGGGDHEVAIVAADGSDLRALTLPGRNQHSARPSPGRDEIAFIADQNGSFDLFVADLSGAGARALTDTPQRNEFAPRWSPDGELLVVTSSPTENGQPRLVDREALEDTTVVVYDRAGNRLLETPGMMPDWMPPWR